MAVAEAAAMEATKAPVLFILLPNMDVISIQERGRRRRRKDRMKMKHSRQFFFCLGENLGSCPIYIGDSAVISDESKASLDDWELQQYPSESDGHNTRLVLVHPFIQIPCLAASDSKRGICESFTIQVQILDKVDTCFIFLFSFSVFNDHSFI